MISDSIFSLFLKTFIKIILFFQVSVGISHKLPRANGGYQVYVCPENLRVLSFIVNVSTFMQSSVYFAAETIEGRRARACYIEFVVKWVAKFEKSEKPTLVLTMCKTKEKKGKKMEMGIKIHE